MREIYFIRITLSVWLCLRVKDGGRRGLYPAAATAPLLLLLLLDELHGGGRGRGRPHGPDHLDAVLRQRRQVEALPAPHLHLLELLETPQGELDRGRNSTVDTGVWRGSQKWTVNKSQYIV